MEFLVALHPVYKCALAAIILLALIRMVGKSVAESMLSWSLSAYNRYNVTMGCVILALFVTVGVGAVKFIMQLFGF